MKYIKNFKIAGLNINVNLMKCKIWINHYFLSCYLYTMTLEIDRKDYLEIFTFLSSGKWLKLVWDVMSNLKEKQRKVLMNSTMINSKYRMKEFFD